MENKRITSPRGSISYWISRHTDQPKSCVVFCHGLMADHTQFDRQLAFWCERATVIAWDIPLHGESRPYEDFSLDHAAEELRGILDAEGIDKAVLAGQSAGGYVAQAFVRLYPQRCAAFVGIDTTPFGRQFYTKMDLFWIRRYTDVARLYPFVYYCRVASRTSGNTPESENGFRDSLQRLGRQGMLAAARSVYSDFLNYEDPVPFPCPVLLIVGEFDRKGQLRRYNQQWADLTGYPLLVLGESAHHPNEEQDATFNDGMLHFLTESGCNLG